MLPDFNATAAALRALPRERVHGRVNAITGLTITLEGFGPLAAIGDRVAITPPTGAPVMAEIAGFRDGKAQAIALGPLTGLTSGMRATLAPRPALPVSEFNAQPMRRRRRRGSVLGLAFGGRLVYEFLICSRPSGAGKGLGFSRPPALGNQS